MELVTIDEPRKSLNNVKLGEGVRIFNFVNAYGCSIDSGSKVGAFVEIQKGASIGKNCKISSHTFICEGVHKHLADNNISAAFHYPVPCHLQKAYAHLGCKQGDFPNSEYLAAHCISLPMFAELTIEEVNQVIKAVNSY